MRFALAAGAVLLATGAGRAAEPMRCDGFGDLKDHPDLAIARVAGPAKRVYFLRNPDGRNGCPDASAACRDKAYLVLGNQVIAGPAGKDFTCVDYLGAKGSDRAGWVASSSLERLPPATVGDADWAGTWKQVEATIVVKPAGQGRLKLKGDATYGALDPDRVKRGAVNIGSFEADIAARGPTLAFDDTTKGTVPVEQGDESDCKVWMRRLGPYLLADDNNNCGGMNVTFRGVYTRKP